MKATLQKRVKRLESWRAADVPQPPPASVEDERIAERIVNEWYENPKCYAERIEAFEQDGGRNPLERTEPPATACSTE